MATYNVTNAFIDSRTGKRVLPGDTVEFNDHEVIRARKAGVIGAEVKKGDDSDLDEVESFHVGGGYYELPNGEKVRGKEKALAAYQASKEVTPDAKAQGGDTASTGAGDTGADQEPTED